MSWGYVAAAVISAAVSYDQGERAKQQQEEAQNNANARAKEAAKKAELARNKANRRAPDRASIMANAARAGARGASSTMLTGPQGVTGALPLGGSTLLGS